MVYLTFVFNFQVRGLLLYGKPGCGKTLLARTLGGILSPLRPVTVVSGPEIMDKFVGSSEKVRKSFWTEERDEVRLENLHIPFRRLLTTICIEFARNLR